MKFLKTLILNTKDKYVLSSISIRNISFTRQKNGITHEQLKQYENDGFFVIKKLISEEKLNKFRERFQKICTEKIKVPAMTVMKDVAIVKSEFADGEKAITKIQDFCHDDELFEYCKLAEIIDYVKPLLGPNIMAMHTMLINKPPGIKITKKAKNYD